MSDLNEFLLTGLLNHGHVLLGAILFLAALGLPLPATLLVMATGAFARQGVLQAQTAAWVAMAAAVAGDGSSYLLGRHAAGLLPARLRESTAWHSADRHFARWGSWSVFLSRFLLTPIALPVNLLAGSTRYPWPRFLLAVVAGEALWVLFFGGLGMLFADNWEAIGQLASDVSGLLVGVAVLLGSGYALLRSRSSGPQAAGAADGRPAPARSPQAGKKPSTDR